MFARALPDERPPEHDHIVQLHGVTWTDYRRMQQMRGERRRPRICYLEGTLELMSTSRSHERLKSVIGRLTEAWCLDHDVEFSAYGSWTQEDEAVERAVEPDECYIFGDPGAADRPHLAIEVVWTHGGLDKLEIYRALDVGEVWYWRKGALTVHVLKDGTYEQVERSARLPDLDVEQLCAHLDERSTSEAIKAFRASYGR